MAETYRGQHKIAYFSGESTTFTPTSSYVTYAEVPGTARNLVFEVHMSPSTGTEPIDFRLMQSMPRHAAQTSDLKYNLQSTQLLQKTSSFTKNTGKNCYMFAAQVRQSTNSTDFGTSVKIKWMGVS